MPFLRGMFVLAFIGGVGVETLSAQSASGIVGSAVGADEEVVNAAQAAEDALKASRTRGAASRGASGSIASLLTSSDRLICSTWILTFRTQYRNMVIDGADAETLRAMSDLMENVERACQRVLDPEVAAGHTPEDGASDEEGDDVDSDPPIYPDCPQCDPFKRALDRRIYLHEEAQWELNEAMGITDDLKRIYASAASPEEILAMTHGETVQEAEEIEGRLAEAEIRARWAVEDAREALVDCLERCHQSRGHSSLGGDGLKYGLAGGAAVAVGVALAAGGGADGDTAPVLMPRPASTDSGGTPNGIGIAACAGDYDATFMVTADPGNHRERIAMAPNMTLTVTIASIHIRGREPFIEVRGSIDSNGNFDASGLGTAAGFPNVTVRMEGTLRGCTALTGTMDAMYTMGAGQEFPGGRPISYGVHGVK